ncbi:MAG: GspH/FimT family pseudopilin [Halioglobus sp.]
MMITVALAAVLMVLVVPAFSDLIANSRMRSEVYSLRGLLMEARSGLMTERRNVTVCRSNDGATCSGTWNEGYIAFFDTDDDGVVDAADGDRIVLARTPDASTITIAFDNAANRVVYNSHAAAARRLRAVSTGRSVSATNAVQQAGGLIVSRIGTMTAAVDSDNPADDIVNDENGVNLVCP